MRHVIGCVLVNRLLQLLAWPRDHVLAVAENHDTTGAALVLVDRRTQMHEKYKLKSLRSAAPTRIGTSNGFARGREAGNTASLSTQGAVVSRKQLAS